MARWHLDLGRENVKSRITHEGDSGCNDWIWNRKERIIEVSLGQSTANKPCEFDALSVIHHPRILTIHDHYSNPPDSHPDFSQLGLSSGLLSSAQCFTLDASLKTSACRMPLWSSHLVKNCCPLWVMKQLCSNECNLCRLFRRIDFVDSHEKHRESSFCVAWLIDLSHLNNLFIHRPPVCWVWEIRRIRSPRWKMLDYLASWEWNNGNGSNEAQRKTIRQKPGMVIMSTSMMKAFKDIHKCFRILKDIHGYSIWSVLPHWSLCLSSVMLVSSDSSHRDNSSLSFTYEMLIELHLICHLKESLSLAILCYFVYPLPSRLGFLPPDVATFTAFTHHIII